MGNILLTGSTDKKFAVLFKTAWIAFQYLTVMVVRHTCVLCISGHINYLQQITEMCNHRKYEFRDICRWADSAFNANYFFGIIPSPGCVICLSSWPNSIGILFIPSPQPDENTTPFCNAMLYTLKNYNTEIFHRNRFKELDNFVVLMWKYLSVFVLFSSSFITHNHHTLHCSCKTTSSIYKTSLNDLQLSLYF